MSDAGLCLLDANETSRLLRNRARSPIEAPKVGVARADTPVTHINALALRVFDRVLAATRRSRECGAGRDGGRQRPEGHIPSVRDDGDVFGEPGTFVFLTLADHATPAIANLVDGGAITHAVAECPQPDRASICSARLHAVARTQWTVSKEVVAVAVGPATRFTGSDSASGIRVSAFTCDLADDEAPCGRNPGRAELALDPLFHIGSMTPCERRWRDRAERYRQQRPRGK